MARLLLVGLSAASLAVAPSASSAAGATLEISAVGHGTVTFAPAASDVASDDGCTPDGGVVQGFRSDLRAGTCTLTYSPGDAVRLHAAGGPSVDPPDSEAGPATTFLGWSDDRCPAASADCTVPLEPGAQSVAAIFSPQRVAWWVVGSGAVASDPSTPASFDCANGSSTPCEAKDYAFGTLVSLTAAPTPPVTLSEWLNVVPNQDRTQTLCDEPPSATCRVAAIRPRWAAAIFGGEVFAENVPPEVEVNFRIRKAGSGSGTVRSQSIECGTRCEANRKFGDGETLEAIPDGGSRFDHWGAACGTAPRCSLAVGPVTAVTAVFERGSSSAPLPGGGGSANRALRARVLRLNVRGHGRRRAILIRLELNAASTVRAVLLRGRRQVAAKRFRVRAGTHLLRFRVPVRARPGRFRLRLTIRGNGQTKQLTQRVRLRR